MLCTQPNCVSVSGSYAYVAAFQSDSLVVVDISNPASPVIRGSVSSSSLMDYVRAAWSCGPGSPPSITHAPRPSRSHVRGATAVDTLSRSHAPRSHMLCTQPSGVAVSGSYAYVSALFSDSLVVIDISNPASPAIRGSVVSSNLLDGVRVIQSRVRPVHHARVHGATAAYSLSRSHSFALMCCAHRLMASP